MYNIMLLGEGTVITIDGGGPWSIAIALVHVATWVTAFFVTMLGTHEELRTHSGVSSQAKALSLGYSLMILVIIVVILFHAGFAKPPNVEKYSSSKLIELATPFLSTMLLFTIVFENMLGSAYLSYVIQLSDNDTLYSMTVASNVLVALGSSMVVAFYVMWAKHESA
jgi:hypothetical protein